MIELKLKEVVEAIGALTYLNAKPMRGVDAYRVSKLVRVVNGELKLFDEARGRIIEQYNNVGEVKEWLDKELKELLEMEIKLEVNPLPWSMFEAMEIAPENLSLLEKFIEHIEN